MSEKLFSEYLIDKYADWIKTQKEAKSTADFAAAVGINRQTMNKLLEKGSNNIPQLRTVHALAKVVGNDIYNFLGISQSEIEFDMIKQSWDHLPPEVRAQIVGLVKPFLPQ